MTPQQSEKGKVDLLFVGDIMLSRSVGDRMIWKNDFRFPFYYVASTTSEVDIAFANLETSISSRGRDQGSIYSFRADPRVLEGLTFAGFDVLSVANNHIWDWGSEALIDTLDLLVKNNIQPVGAGRNEMEANAPIFLTRKNTKFAFLAYTNLMPKGLEAGVDTPGLSHHDRESILGAIRAVRAQANIVIVSFHWGEEYEHQANSLQRVLARQMVEAGADLVIGHHPHVVQELEHYQSAIESSDREGWIAYSLGNFVFDQSFSTSTMTGMALFASVRDGKIINVSSRTVAINTVSQPSF
jgi:poly-gamma-glutamate synthesis protein (capsule biosynthesis protein)